jgi:predicted membrane metal-binding protein
MTSTVLAISAAYVVIGVLVLAIGLYSRFPWWIKAAAIVVTSAFFIEAFFATKGLLGWPQSGSLPARFQLLWVRVVEPDLKTGDQGAVFLWVESVDEHNVPEGIPRSYRLPYTRPLADRSSRARDEILRGRPQQGSVEEMEGQEHKIEAGEKMPGGGRIEGGIAALDHEQLKLLEQAQRVQFAPMQGPTLPPKGP